MQLKTARLYCDVVAQRSFSKAALLNEVSQSLVSQAVTSLESRLGVTLIDRSKRPLEPTRAGQAYAVACRELLDGFDAVEDDLHRLADKVTGQVRIAAIYSVGLLEMSQYVERFREQYPDANVRMEYLHPDQVYDRIRSDDAEIGLLSFPREGGEFRSYEWQQQDVVLIVPPEHPMANQRSVSPSQINGLDFVSFTKELKIRQKLDRWLKAAGVSINTVHKFDNVENIKRSVEIGSGVALVPLQTVRRELEYGSLRAVTVRGVDWKRPLGVVQKRNRKLTIATSRFVELLLEKKTPRRKPSTKRGTRNTPATRLLAD
jgi:DNA-binding transcriptional LysR family regulator